jgi:beta-lactamase class A
MIVRLTKLSILLLIFMTGSRHNPSAMNDALKNRVSEFGGDAGLYFERLDTGEKFELNADSLYPTASMIKVPILITLFNKIDEGLLGYRDDLVWYADSVNYPYDEGILSSFSEGSKITVSKVISLMITYSDNHAALWCQKLAGGGETVNAWLADNGFVYTRVNSRTPGRRTNWEKYGWGQTTPREMARLLTMIRNGQAVSPAASAEMYRVLGNIYWYGEALSQIPPQIRTISKQGAVDQSRSEVVLVNAPACDYVFCIITNNQKDIGWEYTNTGYVLIRDISAMLWKYIEPDMPWQLPPGMKKYR